MLGDAVVLCYHALSEDWPAPLAVRPRAFERQILIMLERGYRATTFARLSRDRPTEKTFVVTFDDAFRSVVDLALPILQRHDVPATVFAVSDFASRGGPLRWSGIDEWANGPHATELEGLNWSELRPLIDIGWEVGSHTVSHPRLPAIGEERLHEELSASRERCERELGECQTLAYPYGDVDARVAEAARSAGYSAAAGMTSRSAGLGQFGWPRVGVWRGDDLRRFRLKVSSPVRRVRLRMRR